ncbi:MAG: hypothetical protein L3J07_04050 [Candidatus Magasanikbacteria bacterium]|nr:hypothetical protein [Candidatus Magasanikbacteria bacterium]
MRKEEKLPILPFEGEIVSAVRDHNVVVITAKTGAGKSTQVVRFLAEAGYRVVCTQPRRLATRTVAARVAKEIGVRLGGRVGYRTGVDRADSAATEILFCTDGLQLVRELSGSGVGERTVLVLDEVHEWNTNMEVLVAWTRKRIEDGDDLRVVLMSATLDAERLASYFGGVPVISVPGRLFPVEKRNAPAYALLDEVEKLAGAGRNVLVFQPGKKEIAETVSALQAKLGASAIVRPLHGGLEYSEQQLCFEPAPTGKVKVVVSTNVAQTSVTIPDIDAVVDSGLERRIELVDGIEGLYLKDTSQADCTQRAGRAGRTKAGVYILCSATSIEDRLAFPKAEILRSRLDQTVLRLAVQGFDATALKFFHQPDETVLAEAKRALVALGAMSSDGEVTKTGRRMAKFSVSVGFARMLIEAERLGVVEQVATIAACLEVGDIRARDGKWKSLTQENQSDLLAVLDVFNVGKAMKGGHGRSKVNCLRDAGIFTKDFFRADEIRRKLLSSTRRSLHSNSKSFATKELEKKAILRACVAGMVDHLYQKEYSGYKNGDGWARQLDNKSVVSSGADWIVGIPFDISGKGRRGSYTLRLVGMATEVDPNWLCEVAPHLAEKKTGLLPTFCQEKDTVVSTTKIFFNGTEVGEQTVDHCDHPDSAEIFAGFLANNSHVSPALEQNQKQVNRARELNVRAGEEVFEVQDLEEFYLAQLDGAKCAREIKNPGAILLPALDEELVELVLGENPDTINLFGSDLVVKYRDYNNSFDIPQVKLTDEMVKANSWIQLSDEGVRLPGGRLLEVVASFGYYATFKETDVPTLKKKMCEYLNVDQWHEFLGGNKKPEVKFPELLDEDSSIPFVTSVYGQCVVTGEDLFIYSTLIWSSSYGIFENKRVKDLNEAKEVFQNSVLQLAELKIQNRGKFEAKKLQETLGKLIGRKGWYDLKECDSKKQAGDRRYCYLSSSVEELSKWIAETKVIITEVEVLFEKLEADLELEQEVIAVILRENGDNLDQARQIRAFADKVVEILGSKEKATQIFNGELNAPYGRARRQDAIADKVSNLDWCCQGDEFFSLGRARDLDLWLQLAITYLDSTTVVKSKSNGKKKVAKVNKPAQQTSKGNRSLNDLQAMFNNH